MLKGNLLFLRLVSALAIGLAVASTPAFSYAATNSALFLPPAGMGSIVLVNLDGGNETLSVNFAGTMFTVSPQGGVSPNQVEFNLPPSTYSYTASVAGIGSVTNSINVVAGRVLSLAFSDNLADLANGDQNGDDQSVTITQVVSADNDDENAESDENNENETEQSDENSQVSEGENNESAETENAENDQNFSDDGGQIEAGKFFGNGQFGHFPFNGFKNGKGLPFNASNFNNGQGNNFPFNAGKPNGNAFNTGKGLPFNAGNFNGKGFNKGQGNNFPFNAGKPNGNAFNTGKGLPFNAGKPNGKTFNNGKGLPFNAGNFNDKGFNNGQNNNFNFNAGKPNGNTFNTGKGTNLPFNAGKFNGSTFNSGKTNNFIFNAGKSNGNTFNSGRSNNFNFNTGKPNGNTFNFNSGKGNNSTFNNACTMLNPACGFNNGGGNQGKSNNGKRGDVLTVSYTPDVSGPVLTVANDGGHDSDDNGDNEGSEQVVRTVTTPAFDNDELLVTVTDVTAQAQ